MSTMKPRKPLKQEAPTVTLDVSELRKSVTFIEGQDRIPKIDYSFLLRGADGPISEKDRATLDHVCSTIMCRSVFDLGSEAGGRSSEAPNRYGCCRAGTRSSVSGRYNSALFLAPGSLITGAFFSPYVAIM